MRDRKEMIQFSQSDIELIAKQMAKLRIIGDLFIGKILDQEVQWRSDGSLNVVTTYQEGTLDDIKSVSLIEKDTKKHK